MRIHNPRRTGAVAALAMASTLAFGATAQAAAPAASAATTAGHHGPHHGSGPVLKQRGEVARVGTVVAKGRKATVFQFATGGHGKPGERGRPGERGVRWLAGHRTKVVIDGRPAKPSDISRGDTVTVVGHPSRVRHGLALAHRVAGRSHR